MSVKWFQSLAFKLFLFVAFQVIATALVVSWQNIESFKMTIDKQTQEQVSMLAEKTAFSLGEMVREWLVLAHLAGHSTDSTDITKPNSITEALTKSNKEIIAIEIIEQTDKKITLGSFFMTDKNTVDPSIKFADLPTPEKIKEKFLSLHKKFDTNAVQIITRFDFNAKNQLLLIGVPLKIKTKSDAIIWIHMLISPKRAIQQLVAANGFNSFLLDEAGIVTLSPEDSNTALTSKPQIKNWTELYNKGNPVRFTLTEANNGDKSMLSLVLVEGFKGAIYLEKRLDDKTAIAPQLKRTMVFSWIIVWISLAMSYFSASFVSNKLHEVIKSTLRIASGDFNVSLSVKSKDEIGLLSLAVNKLAQDIGKLVNLERLSSRQEAELRTAQAVQGTLFPKLNIAEQHGISVFGKYTPATECAGDWWWTFSPSPDHHIVIVGDAVGHGASAALLVAVAYSFVQTMTLSGESFESPVEVMKRLNAILFASGNGQTTMTMCCAIFDLQQGHARVVCAGHVNPFMVNAITPETQAPSGKSSKKYPHVKSILCSGDVLGQNAELTLSETTQEFYPGDKFTFFTDGLLECQGVDKSLILKKELHQFAEENRASPGEKFFTDLEGNISNHFRRTELTDDVTFVVVEISREWKRI